MKNIRHYNVIFKSDPDGGFTVVVPSLPGCVTWGKTISHAREMARDAIDTYIVSLQKHGEAIPSDDDTMVTETSRHYAS